MDFKQRPAKTDPTRKIVVNENSRIECGIFDTGLHSRSEVPAITHQEDAGKVCHSISQAVQTVEPVGCGVGQRLEYLARNRYPIRRRVHFLSRQAKVSGSD